MLLYTLSENQNVIQITIRKKVNLLSLHVPLFGNRLVPELSQTDICSTDIFQHMVLLPQKLIFLLMLVSIQCGNTHFSYQRWSTPLTLTKLHRSHLSLVMELKSIPLLLLNLLLLKGEADYLKLDNPHTFSF